MHHRATLRFGRGSPASYCWTWWSAPTCTALADRRPSPGRATCLTNTSSPPSIRRATTSGPRPKGASDEHDESRPHHDDDLRPRSSRHGPSELLGPSSPQQAADSASLAEQHPGQGSAQPGGPWVTPTVSCAGRASAEDAPSAPLPAGARPPVGQCRPLAPACGHATPAGWSCETRTSGTPLPVPTDGAGMGTPSPMHIHAEVDWRRHVDGRVGASAPRCHPVA